MELGKSTAQATPSLYEPTNESSGQIVIIEAKTAVRQLSMILIVIFLQLD